MVLWVDDDERRLAEADYLLRPDCKPLCIHPTDLEFKTDGLRTLDKFLLDGGVGMVVFDYDLTGSSGASRKRYAWRAPFLTGAIDSMSSSTNRRHLQFLPLCLISGRFTNHPSFAYLNLERFDRIFDDDDLKTGLGSRLRADCREFAALEQQWNAHRRSDEMSRLLEFVKRATDVPQRDRQSLEVASTWFLRRPVVIDSRSRLQNYQSMASDWAALTPMAFMRWVRFGLMRIPGPLLDTRRAAVSLSMTPDAFRTYSSGLEKARYVGAFKHDVEGGLWWATTLRDEWAALGVELGDRELEYCVVARRKGRNVPAEVFASPRDYDLAAMDLVRVEQPVARINASLDPSEQLPSPFDRIYRLPGARQ